MMIRSFDHVNEIELRNRAGQQSVVEVVKMRQQRWCGHVLKQTTCYTLDTDEQKEHGNINRQKRAMTQEMREKDFVYDNVVALPEVRPVWRNFVAEARRGLGNVSKFQK